MTDYSGIEALGDLIPGTTAGARDIPTKSIRPNPSNPRLYFNEQSLDVLRTSIQEVGVLVPIIVYESESEPGVHILLDGERRWLCAQELGLVDLPAHVMVEPDPLDNLLLMFNIHAVREDWPLISVALSLRKVIEESGEERESRLAERTGLTRSTVRRAKRLLSLPEHELDLIRAEAHLPRHEQIHREDLYLEIEAAESVLRNGFPEIAQKYSREKLIRQFARKREEESLVAVTDFRKVGRIVQAADLELIPREELLDSLEQLIDDPSLTPDNLLNGLMLPSARQTVAVTRSKALLDVLRSYDVEVALAADFRQTLIDLRVEIDSLLGR